MTAEPIQAQAADWLALTRSGRMSAEETRALEVWLETPEHRAAYDDMQETWRLYGEIEDDPAVMEVREWARGAYNRPVRMRIAASIAAAFVAVGGWGAWWATTPAPVPQELITAASEQPDQEFRTGIGQTTTATLFDGSVVTLDTNSALVAREIGGIRLIELKQGQAFFKVAKDKTRPFKVVAAGKTVTATGTQFSVRADPALFQVTLVEGSVIVEAPRSGLRPGKARELSPGDSLKAADGRSWQLAKVDVTADTSWRAGTLTFYNRPLGEAAAEMNRYSRRKILVDASVADTPIVGVFPTGDVEAFAKAAEGTKIASADFDGQAGIVLTAPKKVADADVHNIPGIPSS
jgi:transmembrane sensor